MNTNPVDAHAPVRAAWLAVGIPLTVVALFFGGLNVWSWMGSQSTVEQHTYRATVTRLDAVIGSGDIQIRPGPDGQVTVRRKLTWAFGRPPTTERVDGATMSIRTNCGVQVVARCSADYTVWVPESVSVRADTSSGQVTVDGVRGGLDLDTSSGDIRVRGGLGTLLARTGSGSILVTGSASADLRAQTGSGDIRLEFDRPPRGVAASTGSGDVEVAVPGHDRYRVTGGTGSGDRVIQVVQDPGADRSIRADTGSGDVVIRYLDG